MTKGKEKCLTYRGIVVLIIAILLVVSLVCALFFYVEYKQYLRKEKVSATLLAKDDSMIIELLLEEPTTMMDSFVSGPLFSKDVLDNTAIISRMSELTATSSLEEIFYIKCNDDIIHGVDFNLSLTDDMKSIFHQNNEKKILQIDIGQVSYIAIIIPDFFNGIYQGSVVGLYNSEVFYKKHSEYRKSRSEQYLFFLMNSEGTIMLQDSTMEVENLLSLSDDYMLADGVTVDSLCTKIQENESIYFEMSTPSNKAYMVYITPYIYSEYVMDGWVIVECHEKLSLIESVWQELMFSSVMIMQMILLMIGVVVLWLKNEEAQLEMSTIIENIPGGVHRCQLFDDIHIDYMSDGLSQMCGYTSEEMELNFQNIYTNIMVEEDREIFTSAIHEMAVKEQSRTLEYRIKHKDGHEFWAMDCITSKRDINGKMRAYAVVIDFDDTKSRYDMQTLISDGVDVNLALSLDIVHNHPCIEIRTFGFFDVFVDGAPIHFKSAKAKELLAVLVDRKGGYVTSSDGITYLYDDDAEVKVLLARYRKAAMNLKHTLEENGIIDLVKVEKTARRLDISLCRCDYYDYLNGDTDTANQFHGSYMLNYSWAEDTTAILEGMLDSGENTIAF